MALKPARGEGELDVGRANSNMHTPNYLDAKILLFDRKRNVRKQTRSVLNGLGFRKFLEFDDLVNVRAALCTQRVDIMVMNVDLTDCGVVQLVNEIRGRETGLDPFVPILLTSWDAKLNSVRSVAESGADGMLLYPFSTTQMAQRIDCLAQARKPFVVTEDYLGPDRRAMSELRNDPSTIVVPNALRAQVYGLREAAPNREHISQTLRALRRLKLRNLSRRVCYLATGLRGTYADQRRSTDYDRDLSILRNSLTVFRRTLIGGDGERIRHFFEATSELLNGMFGLAPSEKYLALLEQNALALRMASRLEHEASEADNITTGEVAEIGKLREELIRTAQG